MECGQQQYDTAEVDLPEVDEAGGTVELKKGVKRKKISYDNDNEPEDGSEEEEKKLTGRSIGLSKNTVRVFQRFRNVLHELYEKYDGNSTTKRC